MKTSASGSPLGFLATADGWLRTEIGAAADRMPRAASLCRWLAARPVAVIVALSALRGSLDALGYQHPQDPHLFSAAADTMLSGGWAETFADERVQTGPLQLLFYAPLGRIADLFGVDVRVPLSIMATIAFSVAVLFVARLFLSDAGKRSPGAELFVGLVTVLGGLSWTAATSGHPSEGFIPLLWLLAARDAQRGRPGRAGLLIGLSAGFKLWGVMAVPLLLLSPGARGLARGLAIQAATVGLLYGPFLIGGRVEMFDYVWDIRQQSPLRFLFGPDIPFTWSMRLAQGAVILAAGAGLSLLARGSRAAAWAVPLGIVAARLLVDPLDYHYYWLPVGTILLVAMATTLPQRISWLHLPAATVFYATLLPFFLMGGVWLAAFIAVASTALLALALLASRPPTAEVFPDPAWAG